MNSGQEVHLEGLALSEGCVVGRVCMFNENRHRSIPAYRVEPGDIPREIERLRNALKEAEKRVEEISAQVRGSLGEAEAGIFLAQKMILGDETVLSKIRALIRHDALNAEAAIARVLDEVEASISALDDAYIKERSSDVGEVRRRLLDLLVKTRMSLECDEEGQCRRGQGRVVVAEELTPALTVELGTDHLLGFVTERGGNTSHGAILARALGIPAVSGVHGIRDKVACGVEVLVDGSSGKVVLWPQSDTVVRSSASCPVNISSRLASEPVPGLRVMANIERASDVRDAVRLRAEGVGLYRTEMDLMADLEVSEERLAERYISIAQQMQGHPVFFRAFDVGSDKPLPFLKMPREDNPALGCRGARLLLKFPDLFRVQARALARAAAHGSVRVMYPMIVDVEQFRSLRDLFNESVKDLPKADIQQGVMLEVPSACLAAEEILATADFASIGTNDLLQYLYAVDRNNETVAADFSYERGAFWKMIDIIVHAAQVTKKPLSVCGEIAGEPQYLARLIDAGISTVSVNTRRIALVREAAVVHNAARSTG